MLYSHNNQFPKPLPERIRLSSGLTRTDSSTFTEEEISDAGYVSIEDPPAYDSNNQKIIWNETVWEVVDLTDEEISARNSSNWAEVRESRELKIKEIEWRIFRYQSELRIGITTTTDDISKLDNYMQALRNITNTTSDPIAVVWPSLPSEENVDDINDND